MLAFTNLIVAASALMLLEAGTLIFATPTLLPRQDCTGVAPSLGGQACGGTAVMTCLTTTTWSCPNGNTGVVPPGTQCICNAFRHPGWEPNGTQCTSGIVCVTEGGNQFRVCGVSGLQPPQNVPPGTVCRNGGIVWP